MLQPTAPEEDVRQFLDGIAAMDPTAYWGTLLGLLDARASDVLPAVKVPVAIVSAAQDTLMPRVQVERMRAGLPHASFVEIQQAGHAGLVEQGPKMVAAVRALLTSVEGPAPGI